jgi:antitoxin (DNA-binding transcriptional repressor) of toxin-antitoxin stability system
MEHRSFLLICANNSYKLYSVSYSPYGASSPCSLISLGSIEEVENLHGSKETPASGSLTRLERLTMPLTVSTIEAKAKLSQLLERARRGERVIITRRGVPVAELTAPHVKQVAEVSKVIEELKALRLRTRSGTESVQSMIWEGRRF